MTNLKIRNPFTKQHIFYNQMVYNHSFNSMIHFSLLCFQVIKWMIVIYSWNSMIDIGLLCI